MSRTTLTIDEPRAGIGFRTPHFGQLVAARPNVGFLEVHVENYLCGGPLRRQLATVRRDWPLSLHGVGLSLGSAGGIDIGHLRRVAALVDEIDPSLISEHLSWSSTAGLYLNDLLPLPYSEESLDVVADNIDLAQEVLGCRLLIENPSAYLRFAASTLDEPAFLVELVRRTGCGILFDVNNVVVSCHNLNGGDPQVWIDTLPVAAVAELHLAGHSINDADGVPIRIDDHGSPVSAEVWQLYAQAVRRFPQSVTLIEWDANLPGLDVLVAEAERADGVRRSALAEASHAVAA
jgi:uncharacterized protein (UPF0276 family)